MSAENGPSQQELADQTGVAPHREQTPGDIGTIAMGGIDTRQPGFAPKGIVQTGGPHPELLAPPFPDNPITEFDDPIRPFICRTDEFPGFQNL